MSYRKINATNTVRIYSNNCIRALSKSFFKSGNNQLIRKFFRCFFFLRILVILICDCSVRSAAQLHHNSLRLLLFTSGLMKSFSLSLFPLARSLEEKWFCCTKYASFNDWVKMWSRKKYWVASKWIIFKKKSKKNDGAQILVKREESYEVLHSTEV